MQANDVTWPAVAWVCKSMKLGICTGFEHVETKTEDFFAKKLTFFRNFCSFKVQLFLQLGWSTSFPTLGKSKRSAFHLIMNGALNLHD